MYVCVYFVFVEFICFDIFKNKNREGDSKKYSWTLNFSLNRKHFLMF